MIAEMTDYYLHGDEIIRRLIDAASPIYGPTGYRFEINYCAPNDCEPPFIGVNLHEDDDKPALFDFCIDQNTTAFEFRDIIHKIEHIVELCANADKNRTDYETERKKEEEEIMRQIKEGEIPF